MPMRLITGAFILNSGLSKRNADEDTASYLHGEASRAWPFLKDMEPKRFTQLLSNGEIALGAALLLPVFPSALVGTALTGFAGGLLGLYFSNPEARMSDGIRPTPEGLALAKDSWLFGIGLSLMMDGMAPARCGRKHVRKHHH
nr:hypothetical protein [Marinactinospora thermotolerans]